MSHFVSLESNSTFKMELNDNQIILGDCIVAIKAVNNKLNNSIVTAPYNIKAYRIHNIKAYITIQINTQ